MKRLLLLRHAKTVPAGPGIEDHERELNPRGCTDASAVGKYLARHKYRPDLVLCSTARRTVETVDLAVAAFDDLLTVDYLDDLYLADPKAILVAIHAVADSVRTLLLVGHNPGMEKAASLLAREPVRRKERDRFDAIEEKFPTGALAVLDFDIAHWRDVAPGEGALTDFIRPRDL